MIERPDCDWPVLCPSACSGITPPRTRTWSARAFSITAGSGSIPTTKALARPASALASEPPIKPRPTTPIGSGTWSFFSADKSVVCMFISNHLSECAVIDHPSGFAFASGQRTGLDEGDFGSNAERGLDVCSQAAFNRLNLAH